MRTTRNEPFLDKDMAGGSLPLLDFGEDDATPKAPSPVPMMDFGGEDDFEVVPVPQPTKQPDFSIDYLINYTNEDEDDFSLGLDDFDNNKFAKEDADVSLDIREAMEIYQKQLDVLEKDERKFLISEGADIKNEELAKAVIERIDSYPDFKVDPTYRKTIGSAIVRAELDSSQAIKFFNESPELRSKNTNNDIALKAKAREFILSACDNLRTFISVGRNSKSEYRNANLKLFKTLFSDLMEETRQLGDELDNSQSALIKRAKSIKLGANSYKFTCAACNHETEVQGRKSPVTFLVREKTDNSDNMFYGVLGKMKCASCGELNMLNQEVLKMLNEYIALKMSSVVDAWIYSNRTITSLKKVFVWDAPNSLIEDAYPDIFQVETQEEDTVEIGKVDLSNTMRRWYEETRQALSMVKSRKFVSTSVPTFITPEAGVADEHLDTIRDIVYLFCEKFSLDYDVVFEYALSSVMAYFEERPSLMALFNFDSLCLEESSSLLLNYFNPQGPTDKWDEYAKVIAKSIAIKEDTSIPTEEFNQSVIDRLQYFRQSYQTQKQMFDSGVLLKSLNKSIAMLRFIPLINKNFDTERYAGVLINDQLRKTLFMIANQVILFHLSDQISEWVQSRHRTKQIVGIDTLNVLTDKAADHSKFVEKAKTVISSATQIAHRQGSTVTFEDVATNTHFVSLVNLSPVADVDNIFEELVSAIENKDYYLFCKSVLMLATEEGMRTLVMPLASISEVYLDVFNFVKEFTEPAANFLRNSELQVSDNEVVNYYFYHYGNQFTLEEIQEGSDKVTSLWKPYFTLQRVDDESFSTYLKRLSGNRNKEDKLVVTRDHDKFYNITTKSVLLYAVSLLYSRGVKNLKELRRNSLIVDMVNAYYCMGQRPMYYLLGLERSVPADLDLDKIVNLAGYDIDSRRMKIVLDNFIYLLDGELNSLGDDSESEELEQSYSTVIYNEPNTVVPYLDLLDEVGDMLRANFGL